MLYRYFFPFTHRQRDISHFLIEAFPLGGPPGGASGRHGFQVTFNVDPTGDTTARGLRPNRRRSANGGSLQGDNGGTERGVSGRVANSKSGRNIGKPFDWILQNLGTCQDMRKSYFYGHLKGYLWVLHTSYRQEMVCKGEPFWKLWSSLVLWCLKWYNVPRSKPLPVGPVGIMHEN